MGGLHSPFGLLSTPHGAQMRIPAQYLCRQISAYRDSHGFTGAYNAVKRFCGGCERLPT